MITIKEEFLRNPKVLRAIKLGGHDAITLWLALKSYAAQHPTNGFVPDEELDGLCAGLVKAPRKRILALVECGRLNPDGSRGSGLVDPHDLGWQLHDYLDHATSSDEVEERIDKDRERKRAQRERVKLRRLLVDGGVTLEAADQMTRAMTRGQVQDEIARLEDNGRDGHGTVTGQRAGRSRDNGRDNVTDGHADTSQACAPPRTGPRAPTAGRAHPNPTQPNPTISKDHNHDPGASGVVSTDEGPGVAVTNSKIPKPKTSPLTATDLAQFDVDCPGMPRAFAELAVRDWLSEPAEATDKRFPRQWHVHAVKLVRGTWRDARRRRELLAVLEGDGATGEGSVPPATAEDTKRFERELEAQRSRQTARGLARLTAAEREQAIAEIEQVDADEARRVRQLLQVAS